MNQMPKLNKKVEDSASAESEANLVVPSHEDDKPKYEDSESKNSSNVAVAIIPKRGIEVVATSSGFYNQKRIKDGESFFIKSESDFGEWMKCVDAELEKKRVEFYKLKKAKK